MRNAGKLCDFFDRHLLVRLASEEVSADLEQLSAPLLDG